MSHNKISADPYFCLFAWFGGKYWKNLDTVFSTVDDLCFIVSFLALVCSIMLLISLFFHELLFNNLLTTYLLLEETYQNLLQSSEIRLLH